MLKIFDKSTSSSSIMAGRQRSTIALSLVVLFIFGGNSSTTSNRLYGKFGSVRVFFEPADASLIGNNWGGGTSGSGSWPEGIKLVNNLQPFRPRNGVTLQTSPKRIAPIRRTYIWREEELIISFNMTGISDPATCTRLVPPVTWLSSSRVKVKVQHSGMLMDPTQYAIDLGCGVNVTTTLESSTAETVSREIPEQHSSSMLQVSVPRESAESSLSTLRMNGFTRQDIYRMLDKGPWVLAFDITRTLPRLFNGLQADLGLNQTQAVHIVSHCPYLIAQYARYKGRDVYATFRALMDAGYTKEKLVDDIMRFPSMLAAPPERISGWSYLLQCFNVATDRGLFGKLLRRAPFMYYLNPPQFHDVDQADDTVRNDISTTASGFVAYESLRVLRLLQERDFPDLDKIVRTQPSILLADTDEVRARANFLFNLFMESNPSNAAYAPGTEGLADTVPSEVPYGAAGDGRRGGVRKPQAGRNSIASSRTASPVAVLASQAKLGESETDAPSSSVALSFCETFQSSGRSHISASSQEGGVDELARMDWQLLQKQKAKEQLGALLLTYPAVLSIDYQRMRAAGNALRKAGMRRWEVLQIARRHPPVLGRDPAALLNLVSFLRFYCGMKKADLLYFLNKYPAVLAANVEDIEPKVEYLFQSLGGSQEMLRRFPAFLSFDLEMHTRPRAEFLRAMGIDPLVHGLGFLVGQPAREIADLAGVKVELFNQFQTAYPEHIRKEKDKDAITDPLPKSASKHFWTYDASRESPEDALFDEFDVGF